MTNKHNSTSRFKFVLSVLIMLAAVVSANAQSEFTNTADNAAVEGSLPAPDSSDGSYTLKKGDNEFGLWGGGSMQATSIGGLRQDESRDRRFGLAAFRYGRTIVANNDIALQYTFDAIPFAVATGNVEVITVGSITTLRRETTYGGGITPLGLQLDFRNGSSFHPFVDIAGGGLIFNKPVPVPDAGKFAFVGEVGTGIRLFTSDKRVVTLGVRFHHLSNAAGATSNPGLNQFVFYGGFSVFK